MKRHALFIAALAAFGASQAQQAFNISTKNPAVIVKDRQNVARFQRLMGTPAFSLLKNNWQVVSVLQNDANMFAFSGCQKGNCGETQSLVLFDRKNNTLSVRHFSNGKFVSLVEPRKVFNEALLNIDVKAAIANASERVTGAIGTVHRPTGTTSVSSPAVVNGVTAAVKPAGFHHSKDGFDLLGHAGNFERISKLIGDGVAAKMRDNWQVISVLQNDGRIKAYSGCQKGNCAETNAVIIHDLKNDVLDVHYFLEGDFTHEAEKEYNEALLNNDVKAAIANGREAAEMNTPEKPVDFVRVARLVGEDTANVLLDNWQVTSELQNDGRIKAHSGCQKGNCAETQALVIRDLKNGAMEVVFMQNGQQVTRREGHIDRALLNDDVKQMIARD